MRVVAADPEREREADVEVVGAEGAGARGKDRGISSSRASFVRAKIAAVVVGLVQEVVGVEELGRIDAGAIKPRHTEIYPAVWLASLLEETADVEEGKG